MGTLESRKFNFEPHSLIKGEGRAIQQDEKFENWVSHKRGMLIEDSHLNTVMERMETDLLFGCLFSVLRYGEREPGPVNSKCVHFICYAKCAELRRFLVNEDN